MKLVQRAPNGGVLKIAPPNFSFINLTDSCKFQDFLKKWNAHNFFIFKARLLIFWVIGHANDLVTWYDWHNDWTRLSPVLGCGSLRPPPMKISRSNTPWLIGLIWQRKVPFLHGARYFTESFHSTCQSGYRLKQKKLLLYTRIF